MVLTAVAQGLTDNRETRHPHQQRGGQTRASRGEVDEPSACSISRWHFRRQVLRLDTTKNGRPGMGIVTRFPRGLILGITPFNFP